MSKFAYSPLALFLAPTRLQMCSRGHATSHIATSSEPPIISGVP